MLPCVNFAQINISYKITTNNTHLTYNIKGDNDKSPK